MPKNLIGQVVQYEGGLFQILSDSNTMLRACSYNESCGIETTIFVSKTTGKVVAKKETRK
jgi:hypothetical protein